MRFKERLHGLLGLAAGGGGGVADDELLGGLRGLLFCDFMSQGVRQSVADCTVQRRGPAMRCRGCVVTLLAGSSGRQHASARWPVCLRVRVHAQTRACTRQSATMTRCCTWWARPWLT